MNKSLLVVVGLIVVATVGYIVYMSYFTVKSTVAKDSSVIGNEEKNQPLVMPATDEEKLDALNNLTSSANAPAGTASDGAKEEALNNAAGSPKNNTTPADDAEKIRLLESLKK